MNQNILVYLENEKRLFCCREKTKPLLRKGTTKSLKEAVQYYQACSRENEDYVGNLIAQTLLKAVALRQKKLPEPDLEHLSSEDQKVYDDVRLGLLEDDYVPAELDYAKKVLAYFCGSKTEEVYQDLIHGIER
jgi:hypothetical protein